MRRSSDETTQLIQQARAGSSEALGRLFDSCRRYLLQIAGDDLDPRLQAKGGASDIVQETFLEAQRDFSEFTGETEQELLAWLRFRLRYRLAKFRRCYRQTAKRIVGREISIEKGGHSSMFPHPAADEPSPFERVLNEERDLLLEQAVARLPEEHRHVIELRYRLGLSFEEIGVRMSRTPNSARKIWARAIEKLKSDLRAAARS